MKSMVTSQLETALARHRTAAFATAAVLSLAWLLTKTSTSVLGNLPLAVLAVVTLRAGFSCLERQQRAKLRDARDARAWRSEAPPTTPAPTFGVPPSAAKPDSWRKYVRAPVVEEAWAKFCGSIVQEFLYDTWYKSITPDKEFPAEVRRLLNTAFGQLAHRARRLDLRLAMEDLSELFMEQLELFRDTRESILAATQQPNCLRDMHAAARDRAFQREMKAENNLHPALLQPEGHYKFLKAVSEGAVAYLLDESDLQRPAARVVCRELLASCVFRPLMGWATPYYFNKALHALLREAQQKRAARQKEAAEVSAALAAARSQQMRGHFEFEERLREHSAAEDKALLAAKELRHRLRRKLSQHTRSRSADMLHDQQGGQAQQAEQHQQQQERSQHRQRGDERLQARARSTSPVELAASRSQQQGGAAKPSESSGSTGGAGSLQRDRSFGGSQLRPPRPPALQQGQGGERSPGDASCLGFAVAAAPVPGSTTPQQDRQRAGSSGQETPRLPASSWRLPDVIGGLLPGVRQSADAEEAAVQGAPEGEGDGWESVEASDASLNLLPRRDFSAAHLLAPSVDRQAVASVTPRVTSNNSDTSVSPRPGFVGTARAKVVAADLNTSSSKDFVEFKIRVADDAEEWTVSRRYRNFESLHRQLRTNPAYRLKLPPKRIFVHSNNVEFVEERREQLDRYLQALLSHQQLSQSPKLFDFLRKGSHVYELAPAQNQKSGMAWRTSSTPTSPQPGAQQRKALGGLSRAVLDGTQTVGRGITSASGAVAGSVRQGVSELASAASGGVAKVSSGVAGAAGAVVGAFAGPGSYESQPGLTRRVKSVPFGLDRVSGSSSESLAAVPRGSSGSALTRDKGSLLGRAGTLIRSAMGKDAAAVQLDHSGHSGSSASVHDEHAGGGAGGFLLAGSPAKKASKLFSSLRRSKSRSASPSKGRERSPSRRPRRGEGGSATASRRNSGEVLAPSLGQPGAGGVLPAHVVSSLRSASLEPSSPPLASFPVEPAADLEDCSGVSDPLYDCIDCLFQLQTRGFFRRQVFAVARQALSLVAGEAIDAYLTSKLRLLRQQHTIGRIISQIQASLWPGGVWFQYTPAAQAASAGRERQHASAAAGTYVRPEGMAAAKFLEPSGPAPLDEDEIREAVEALLLRRAPAALVRLIGKNAYASGMLDMFDMLQSQTFCHHLGYGCLEICMVHLFPELKSLFRTLQHGGLD